MALHDTQQTLGLDPAVTSKVQAVLDSRPEMLDRYHATGVGDSVSYNVNTPGRADARPAL